MSARSCIRWISPPFVLAVLLGTACRTPGQPSPIVPAVAEIAYQGAALDGLQLQPGTERSFRVQAPPGTCLAVIIHEESPSALQLTWQGASSSRFDDPDNFSQGQISFPRSVPKWIYQPETQGALEFSLSLAAGEARSARLSLCACLCPSAGLVAKRTELLRRYMLFQSLPQDQRRSAHYEGLIAAAIGTESPYWLWTFLGRYRDRARGAALPGAIEHLEGLLQVELSAAERYRVLEHLDVLYGRAGQEIPLEFHENWLAAAEESGETDAVTRCLVARAAYHRKRSELARALDFGYRARKRLEDPGHLSVTTAEANHQLGEILTRLGRFRQAACFFNKAVAAVPEPRLDQPGGATRAARRGRSYLSLAFAQQMLGLEKAAAGTFGQLRQLYEAFPPDVLDNTAFLGRWGRFLKETGDFEGARETFQDALRTLKTEYGGGDDWLSSLDPDSSRNVAYFLHDMALLEAEADNPAAARSYFRQALRGLCRAGGRLGGDCRPSDADGQGGGTVPTSAIDEETALGFLADDVLEANELAAYYRTLASIERAHQRDDKAIALLEKAWLVLEGMRASGASGASTLEFDSARHHLFVDPLVSLLWNQDRLRALLREEESRGRQLDRMLSLKGSPQISPGLLERQEEILGKFAEIESRRQQLPGDGLNSSFPCSSASIEHELDQIQIEISLEAQALWEDTEPAAVNWEEIREELLSDPDVLVLYYSLGRREGHLWMLGSDGLFDSVALEDAEQIEGLVDRFHEGLYPGTREGRGFAYDELRSLSRILLKPALTHLRSNQVVVVIADGALARVPFQLLPHPGHLREQDPPVLIESHELAGVPSLSSWSALRRRSKPQVPSDKEIAIVADPIYERSDERIKPDSSVPAQGSQTSSGNRFVSKRLFRLPEALEEAQSIREIVERSTGNAGGVLLAVGPDANRDLFLSGQIDGYPVLHFATHADAHPLYPEFSNLVLARFDTHGRERNPYLRVYEIARRNLAADLVVLSACRSGDGLTYQGEGVVGLTQSFFAAGARRAVVSLWDVDDAATRVLMEYFYQYLYEEKETAVRALRLAQIKMSRHEHWGSDPFYWAGFMVQGDWRQ